MNKSLAEKVLSLSKEFHADAAEVYFRSYSSTTIEVKDQKIDALDLARDIGAGLRVFAGGRMGFAFTTDLSEVALRNLAREAVTNAQNTEPDPFQSLPAVSTETYPSVAIYDEELARLS